MSSNMVTITTTEIKERLAKSFTDVKTFSKFDSGILNASSVSSRTFSCIDFMGLELICGVYTIDNPESDNAKWLRYVILVGQNKAYYF